VCRPAERDPHYDDETKTPNHFDRAKSYAAKPLWLLHTRSALQIGERRPEAYAEHGFWNTHLQLRAMQPAAWSWIEHFASPNEKSPLLWSSSRLGWACRGCCAYVHASAWVLLPLTRLGMWALRETGSKASPLCLRRSLEMCS
jgi:hypothetical protein